jgi:hypothetical protein
VGVARAGGIEEALVANGFQELAGGGAWVVGIWAVTCCWAC